ncbi:hypothetical protein HT031_004884 [Scenedesmus sp. PABB004]|nr:hypothetical protein HT031_004884 [Scenedesmus sp. PABB004]
MKLILLACALLALGLARAELPTESTPDKGTGAINCAVPIAQMTCTVDTRSGFVAGMQARAYGKGPRYGLRSVCSRGGQYTDFMYAEKTYQTTWDMTDVNGTSFPRNADGTPILEYYFPLGGRISQMLVLKAANPYGPEWGSVAAIVYYTPDTAEPGVTVCGNAAYANAYLYPGVAPPAPSIVTLQSQYVNPLSETTQMFLSSFQGECSQRGFGFLGGDPQQARPRWRGAGGGAGMGGRGAGASKFHIKYTMKACFAPPAQPINFPPQPPVTRPEVSYDWDVPYSPCYAPDKKDLKASASLSCALTGQVVATGKYGVIMVDPAGNAVEAVPDASAGANKVRMAPFSGASAFQGELPDVTLTP